MHTELYLQKIACIIIKKTKIKIDKEKVGKRTKARTKILNIKRF